MNRTISTLDKIIRNYEKGQSIPEGYKLFFLNEKKKQVFPSEPSFLQSLGKKIGTYIISVNETIKGERFPFVLENGIAIDITYSAKCMVQNEEKLLISLFDEKN